MRQCIDNQITLTRDYKTGLNLVKVFPNRGGQTQKGKNILLQDPMSVLRPATSANLATSYLVGNMGKKYLYGVALTKIPV